MLTKTIKIYTSSLTSQPAAYLPAVWLWFELPTPSSRDPTFRWVKYIPTIVQGCHHALCTSVNKPTSRATAQTTRNTQEVVTSMDLKEWKVKVEVRFIILPIQLGSIYPKQPVFFSLLKSSLNYIDLWQTNSMTTWNLKAHHCDDVHMLLQPKNLEGCRIEKVFRDQ